MDTKDIIRRAGGTNKVANAVRRKHNTVAGWQKVPPCHVVAVAELSGVPPHLIRPDVFPPPKGGTSRGLALLLPK